MGVLLIVASWFLLISPQRSEAASLRDQATQQAAFNDQIKLKTQQLKAQFASLPARQAQLAEIKQQMPENPALPSLVRDLSKYAGQADVTLQSVAPSTPAPLAARGAEHDDRRRADTGIQQIQTTIVATGSYSELTLYLQKLQAQMRRAVLVDNIAWCRPRRRRRQGRPADDASGPGLRARPVADRRGRAAVAGTATTSTTNAS